MEIPRDWTFKTADVAKGFDQHVREQLPWYDLMSGATAHIARHYIPDGGIVYDLGCATGNIGNLLRETLDARHCDFRPIDNSETMRDAYTGPGELQVADFSTLTFPRFDVAILFLSLMFIPRKMRGRLVEQLRTNVEKGGVIVVVDKMESIGGYLGTAISRLALAGKVAANVPAGDIIAKELSLAGVQRPLSFEELRPATEVFRFGEFAGYVIET